MNRILRWFGVVGFVTCLWLYPMITCAVVGAVTIFTLSTIFALFKVLERVNPWLASLDMSDLQADTNDNTRLGRLHRWLAARLQQHVEGLGETQTRIGRWTITRSPLTNVIRIDREPQKK